MRKWRRRAIAALVVSITATLAIAADTGDTTLVVTPRLIGVKQSLGSGSQMTVMVQNPMGTAFAGKIVGNCGAAPAMRVAGGTGDPFNVPSSSVVPVQIECPSNLPVGMHRCSFEIRSTPTDGFVAGFQAFCATFSAEEIAATPTSLTFSNQSVGVQSGSQTVTLTNDSAQRINLLGLQVSNENFLLGSPCQNQTGCDAGSINGGATLPVAVFCNPLASGTHTGQLFVVGTNGNAVPPINLTCNAMSGSGSGSGAPVLTVFPSNVTIPTGVPVNTGNASVSVELKNGGQMGTLTITNVTLADAAVPNAKNDWSFTVSGQCAMPQNCALAPTQKLDVRLTFDPSSFGGRPATMIVDYTDPAGTKQVSVPLDALGLGATAELVGTPTIDFGVVPINTQATPRTFKLKNAGNTSTTVTLAAAPTGPFLVPMMTTLPPGDTTINVGCFSTTVTDAEATLSITGPDVVSTLEVPLACDVRNTLLTTNPTSIDYGELRVGASVPPQVVQITTVPGAGSAIGLTSATLSTPNSNLDLGALTAIQTPASTTLTANPQTEGAIATSIVITPTTGDPVPVPVQGQVVTPALVADPVMTLGTFCVGQPVSDTAVSLTSTGTATVQVSSVELLLGDNSPLERTFQNPNTYPASLAPGDKATVLVAPKRSEMANDDVHDTLRWVTDAGTFDSVLTTRFIADGGAVAPDRLEFGDKPVHVENMDAKAVTVQNCSTSPLELVEPAVPAPFSRTGDFPAMLDPGAKATFSILFLPLDVGEVTKQLTIESTGGDMYTVELTGNGITGDGPGPGGDDDGALDETSFYACGCRSNGNPSSVLAIALAVLLVLRRRVSR